MAKKTKMAIVAKVDKMNQILKKARVAMRRKWPKMIRLAKMA